MDALGASEEDWNDYRWQLRHVRRKVEDLEGLIELTVDEREAIGQAVQNRMPFGITPYYLSLMDYETHRRNDHAVRAQVIPPLSYVKGILEARNKGSLDFMREGDTSPIDLVTRRYPMIAILKPYNSCAQICVYCQRNWEIDDVLSPAALAAEEKIREALKWFEDHPLVTEILITGGDPLLVSDDKLHRLLERVAGIEHIKRVRFGSRLPVVLPMRFTDHMSLREASHALEDRALRAKVNEVLRSIGREYHGGTEVHHLPGVLSEREKEIRASVVRPMDIPLVSHPGCHMLRPSGVLELDTSFRPEVVDRIASWTGARMVRGEDWPSCCGGGLSGIDEELSTRLLSGPARSYQASGARAVLTPCPFCFVQFDIKQRGGLPVLFLAELVALSMGAAPERIGMQYHRSKLSL